MSQDADDDSWIVKLSDLNTFKPYYSNLLGALRIYTKEALEHLLLLAVFYIVLCLLLYASIKWRIVLFSNHIKGARRIMIFIAHPDDECMFFGPTILNLTKNSNCMVYLACFSTGTNYGMGKIRKNELYSACKVLGLEEGAIIIRNHSLLPDNIHTKWPADVLAKMILQFVEAYDIDTIITFDKHGVSQHLNHCSIYYALAFLCIEQLLPKDCKIYTLESINLIRKYWSILDIPVCFLLSTYKYILSPIEKQTLNLAMQEHKSQMLWYRKLYFIFSRYIFINTFQEMDTSSIEFDLTVDD